MALQLKHKIVLVAVCAALLPVVVMSIMTFMQKRNIKSIIEDEMNVMSDQSISNMAIDVYKICNVANTIILEQLDGNLAAFEAALKDAGGLHLDIGKTLDWVIVNQMNDQSRQTTLPRMLIGSTLIEKNYDMAVESPVIDRLQKLSRATYTIFQRVNDDGDMLRISTNVKNEKGKRAVGTMIPAVNPDGKPNPVVAALMSGKEYKGTAEILGQLYLTAYKPVKDASGRIIGCIYTGVQINTLEMIKKEIQSISIGKTGYVAILAGPGRDCGSYIVSKDNERDGQNIINEKDSTGRLFIKELIDAAVADPSKVHLFSYMWQNPGEREPREKKGASYYFAPWNWVILPTVYFDDYSEMYNQVDTRINHLLLYVTSGGVVVLLIAMAASWVVSVNISTPIKRVATLAGLIAEGNINMAVASFKTLGKGVSERGDINDHIIAKDETGSLIRSVVTMTKNLNTLVGEVQKATINLVSTSTEIAASARDQEVTVNELSSSSNEIVCSTKEISSTSNQLVATMKEVAEVSSNTSALAEAGRSGLDKMEHSMEQLAGATESIAAKLSLINEKTANINSVVSTITKVADQTNLLSLNASIEAEKAGEYGKGFAVVAREIRRLADQTAVATLDIIKMVKDMESAVSAGVMGMEKFSGDVRASVKDTEQISTQIESVIIKVQGLPEKFDLVIDGMKQQTTGAQQISDAMVQLNDCAHSTSDSLRAFNEAAEQLNKATLNLQKELAIFKVK
ncbi:MAG: methyl-accepting chemotaxis protein [Victivallales bacterium]|nr:methyl-accepting chemotaxis protein [Victivallales bacterium]